MEGSVKSGFLKKSPSGCLIVKGKIDSGSDLRESGKVEGKARLPESDSGSGTGSSDEGEPLELMRRKANEKRLSNRRNEVESSGERKRSRLDLFDFDEYDEFDTKKMRNGKFGDVSRKTDKSNNWNLNGESAAVDGKNKGLASDDDDEENMPISVLKLKCQKSPSVPIQVHGKNGVLKVMVNQKKQKDVSFDLSERNGSMEKNDRIKGMKNEEEGVSPPIKSKKGKEGKAQHGGSTEKQKLREKIKGMLLDSGWTIEYRPRRNRDYLDSVYINPSGTAYWSITKAYDAFKKHLEEEEDDSPSLSEDLINKLTRQARKKIKEEKITGKVTGRCTLMARSNYDKGENPDSGKRTVLAWLVDCGAARLSEKVRYMNRKKSRVMLEGWITRDGVHCGCCSKILTVSKFEMHAGSKVRQPFENIYLESGLSLLQCQVEAWNGQKESLGQDFWRVDVDGDDPDDDTCGVCGDGGDLMCCDGCPSTFHQTCLEIQVLPSGDWHCPNCTCKFCGYASVNVAEENNSSENELNRCSFCEKKYHKSCSEKANDIPMNSNCTSFCGTKCQKLYNHLQKILGTKHELEAGYSWSLVQRKDVTDPTVRGFLQRVECNSKLAVALSVMDECFLPIIDRKSGINVIHNVVYNCGSNFNRLNFRGFYTAILERGDEIISAASIRLHGDCLAEMPFIATREIYRRQGMCRRLLSAIETELSYLKVGRLIIPTILEHVSTWTAVFGFQELEDVHKKETKSMSMLVFPGTDMLQKQLVKKENSDGVKVPDSTSNQPRSPVLVQKSEGEINSTESGSPAPTIHPMPISESDNTGTFIIESTAVEPDAKNEQKESSNNAFEKIEAESTLKVSQGASAPKIEPVPDSLAINEEPLEQSDRDPNGSPLTFMEAQSTLKVSQGAATTEIEPLPDSLAVDEEALEQSDRDPNGSTLTVMEAESTLKVSQGAVTTEIEALPVDEEALEQSDRDPNGFME